MGFTVFAISFVVTGLVSFRPSLCQQQMLSFPLGLPPTVTISTGQTCPSQDNIGIRLILEDSYSVPPCSCGGDGYFIRVAYLNMSDPNQQCPSNWTLTTSPVRGCGRSSAGQNTCDSVLYPVHGHIYSSVCGIVLAYQIRVGARFGAALDTRGNTTQYFYISGLSLVNGPAGSRQHIVTFAAALDEQDLTYNGFSYSSITRKLGHVRAFSILFFRCGCRSGGQFSSVVESKIVYEEP